MRYFLLICFCLPVLTGYTQEKFTLSGHIADYSNQADIEEVNISINPAGHGTSTDEDGKYALELPEGTYTVHIDALGYETTSKTIELNQDKTLDFKLKPSSEQLGEILISQDITESLKSPQMSVAAVRPSTIKKQPALLGETDVIKSLLLLPGVTDGGEISSGFNVRGGSADQNLTLLDQATLYNPSHLFGFFSIFNADALDEVKLYKGGIPARYGGRASSVLDIRQRIGNRQKFKVNGSIGAVSAKLLAEGPIKKGKSSFLVAGRSSYVHLFLKLANKSNSAYFYDLNTKLNTQINKNNTLYFSGYYGRDVFNINNDFQNQYGNIVANMRWNHKFSENFSSDLYFIYSDFNFDLTIDPAGFNYDSGIKNLNLKYDLEQEFSDRFSLNYGLSAKYFFINPGYLKPISADARINEQQLTKKFALQNGLYAQAEHELSDHLSINYGVRLHNFNRLGQDKINRYKDDLPLRYDSDLDIYHEAPITNTYQQSRNKPLKTFTKLEPRFSFSYNFNKLHAFKGSYQRMHQFMQLLTNSNSPTPFNLWVPSGAYINPLRADQYAVGYFRDFEKTQLRLETEVFYKDFKNSIDYINGADLISNDAVERIILNGKARSYGLEFLLRKTNGNLTGWIGYTLSKAEQQTPGRTPEEPGLNNGDWYNTPWDKTHDISLTANYEINEHWNLNTSFVYQTGRPVTFPVAQYEYSGQIIPDYEGRNASRLPDFHHLDLAATYTPKPYTKNNWQGEWVFSIYNIYNRQNTASLNFSNDSDTGLNEARQLSIFGIIPSVSYKFKF